MGDARRHPLPVSRRRHRGRSLECGGPGLLRIAGRVRSELSSRNRTVLTPSLVRSLSLSLLLITSLRLSSITARIALFLVLLALCAPLSLLRTTQRYALPVCAALTGAYLLVLGIDLFVHLGFVDALGLIVASHGVSSSAGDAGEVVVRWTSVGGKGLLAAWWLTAVVSGAWQVYWGLGTDGDDVRSLSCPSSCPLRPLNCPGRADLGRLPRAVHLDRPAVPSGDTPPACLALRATPRALLADPGQRLHGPARAAYRAVGGPALGRRRRL